MAPLKLKKPAPAQATITETHKHKGEVTQEKSEVELVEQAPGSTAQAELPFCEVGVDMSYTMNLGDFNSARFAVSLKMPAQAEEINQVFDYAKEWTEERLSSLVQAAQSSS